MATPLLNIKQKINWRLVALHLAATIFLVIAAEQFAHLKSLPFLEAMEKNNFSQGINKLKQEHNVDYVDEFMYFFMWKTVSFFTGLILGSILSFAVSLKMKQHWINTLLIMIGCIILLRLGLLNNSFSERMMKTPGFIINELELKYRFLINGSIPLIISLALFFNKRINNWIKAEPTAAAENSLLHTGASV